jgi:hypothetical protein
MWLRANPKVYRFLLPYLPYTKRCGALEKIMKIYLLIFLGFTLSCQNEIKVRQITETDKFEMNPIKDSDLTINKELEDWTVQIRKQVIDEVNQIPFDSISIDSSQFYINYFFHYKNLKVKAIGLTKDKLDTVSFYYKSPTSGFMANGETCPNFNTDLIDKGALHRVC